MNKNKIIFLTIVGVILFLLFLLILLTKKDTTKVSTKTPSGAVSIWIYNDSKDPLMKVVEDFKLFNPDYQGRAFEVVSFQSYEEYNLALAAALSK